MGAEGAEKLCGDLIGDENELENSEWTVNTLKEMIDQRFADNQIAVATALLAQEKAVSIAFVSQEKSVSTALLAAKEAVIKAEILTDKRFDAVTDAVAQVSKQTADLLPRAEYTANHGSLNDKIMVVTDAVNRSSGDRKLYATNADVTETVSRSIDSLEVKIVALINPVIDYMSLQKGAAQGNQITMGKVSAMVAATGTVIGIIISLVVLLAR